MDILCSHKMKAMKTIYGYKEMPHDKMVFLALNPNKPLFFIFIFCRLLDLLAYK